MNGRPAKRALGACLLLGLLLAFSLSGCEEADTPAKDARTIEGLLKERETAMRARDVKALVALLSPSYRDKQGGLNEAKALIESAIGTADSVQVMNSERVVEVRGDTAGTSQRYFLVAVYEGLTQTLKGQERLRWRREDGRWRIVGGLTE